MFLSKVSYSENHNKNDFWAIEDVNLGKVNLLVGINATGKTRLMNVLSNFSKIFKQRLKINGHFFFEFKQSLNSDKIMKYILKIDNSIVMHEKLMDNNKILLQRDIGNGMIYSEKEKKLIQFNPPDDEITSNVRRDKLEHPFLEEIIGWANGFHGYSFSGLQSRILGIPRDQSELLEHLENIPHLLDSLLTHKDRLSRIVKDFSDIGYPIEKIGVQTLSPSDIKQAIVKEKDLKCSTQQGQMSQGMYRALSVIVILESLLGLNKKDTIAIDDLGEGLDFERSTKLTRLLSDKVKESNMQLILTSNDRFLINNINLHDINFLKREGHQVKAYNYINSKAMFDEFQLTGLNNFDFLSSGILNKLN